MDFEAQAEGAVADPGVSVAVISSAYFPYPFASFVVYNRHPYTCLKPLIGVTQWRLVSPAASKQPPHVSLLPQLSPPLFVLTRLPFVLARLYAAP